MPSHGACGDLGPEGLHKAAQDPPELQARAEPREDVALDPKRVLVLDEWEGVIEGALGPRLPRGTAKGCTFGASEATLAFLEPFLLEEGLCLQRRLAFTAEPGGALVVKAQLVVRALLSVFCRS